MTASGDGMLVAYLKRGLDPGVVACCCQGLQEKKHDSSITFRGKQMPFENKMIKHKLHGEVNVTAAKS